MAAGRRGAHGDGRLCQAFPRARFITWLRHPETRLVSNYHHVRTSQVRPGAGPDTMGKAIRDGSMTLEEYAEHPDIRSPVSRGFLAGHRLTDLDFVGITEHFDEDLAELGRRFGWPAIAAPRERVSTDAGYAAFETDPALQWRIRELHSEDIELYECALELRARRRSGESSIG